MTPDEPLCLKSTLMAVLEEIHGRYRREERLQRLVPPLEACLEVWRREQRLGL
jgi:hypothetical protein